VQTLDYGRPEKPPQPGRWIIAFLGGLLAFVGVMAINIGIEVIRHWNDPMFWRGP
jgi:hypothetical protein